MNSRFLRLAMGLVLAATPVFLIGCGSGSNSPSLGSTEQDGSVNMMVSDASVEDWAAIGIKVISIALVPQNGGSNVTVYNDAQASAPTLNMVQLDQLGEVLGTVSVPAGTYSAAVITLSGNPTDIQLTSSADPSASLLALFTAATGVPSSQIQVQSTTGSAGSLTVSVTVNFVNPLVVTANSTNSLDLEMDLSHPAFLIGNMGGGSTVWAVNFKGPWHHHPIPDVTKFLLRDIYGTVSSVNSDGSLTITRDYPAEPAAAVSSSENPVSTSHSITVLPDSTNGTLFYDVDNSSENQTIKTYSTISSVLTKGEFVRITARFQTGGTLVAVRTWAASSFGEIYVSPEGHVLHVNTTNNTITVENEFGIGIPLLVTSNTVFYSGSTQIGQGPSFLANIERGFKVHASVVFPLTTPLTADTINIEIARYDGVISAANTTGFTYTRAFPTAKDSYTVTLPYISTSTANGSDPLSGNPITGFKWWNFTFPTIVDSDAAETSNKTDANAINDFVNATGGTVVSFGGTAAPVTASGESYAWWGDPANMTGWSVPWTVLDPTPVQLATTAQGFSSGSPNGTITITVPAGAKAVTVNMSEVAGSGALVYQVSRTGAVVTITPQDITTSQGQTAVASTLISGVPVEVDGIPQPDGTIKAYVVIYYTGTVLPTAVD